MPYTGLADTLIEHYG